MEIDKQKLDDWITKEPNYEEPGEIEKNNVYCVDCLEGMKQLPNNFVDLTITSPPYNSKNGVVGDYYKQYSDEMNQEDYYNFIQEVIYQSIRVTKRYVFFNFQLLAGNRFAYLRLLGHFNQNIKEIIIWNKTQAPPAIEPTALTRQFEFIVVFAKKELCQKMSFETANFNNRKKGKTTANVIIGNNAGVKEGLTDKGENKATFPLYFVNWFLDKFAQTGDTIFDPFNGSGTTTLAAKLKGFNYLGFEIEKAQVEHAKKRLTQTSLFEGSW
jgi:DNA modification methylase